MKRVLIQEGGEWNGCELFFFLVKIAGNGTRWKLEMEVGDRVYLMACFFFHFFAYGCGVVRTR